MERLKTEYERIEPLLYIPYIIKAVGTYFLCNTLLSPPFTANLG